jgi:C-terminal processing protease CtpA/Prc
MYEDDTHEPKSWHSVLAYVLAFSFALGAFFSGLSLGQGMQGEGQMAGLFSIFSSDNEVEAAETAEPDLAEFWEVWEHLEDKFASATTSTISVEDRVEGAISGLVDSYGDPYTVYMPPAVTENFNETISGEFSGVGME